MTGPDARELDQLGWRQDLACTPGLVRSWRVAGPARPGAGRGPLHGPVGFGKHPRVDRDAQR
jgi:hypothetical protein